ncbi:hypothetical protein CA54_46180 [Symmachiella macrocystis]|uniref:Uncharacterized protein n=2 Tax=Symmachiella macrocystis TaxID=2527985 RepID=A0A5C6BCP4_9PLAN|nr:hypothetical protein CA54_46180 [Symmachiella macrocystis]
MKRHAKTSRNLRMRRVSLVVCIAIVLTLTINIRVQADLPGQLGKGLGGAGKKLDRNAIRAEIEKARREMEKKQREMEKSRSKNSRRRSTRNRSTRSRLTRKRSTSRVSTAGPAFGYRVATGQKFAYSVQLAWRVGGVEKRIVGQPLYQVRYRNGSKSTMLVVGRFRHLRKKTDEENFRHLARQDYWLQSVQNLESKNLGAGGHPAVGDVDLPYLMDEFVTLRQLVIPHLPYAEDGKEGKSENAVLTHSADGPTIWRGFTGSGSQGKSFSSVTAKPLGGSSVQLNIRRGFENKADNFSAVYSSSGIFDKSRGLMASLRGTYTLVEGGKKLTVSINVQRLSGEGLAKAKTTAQQDMQEMPNAALPVEAMRKPLASTYRESYSANRMPRQGAAVGYFDESMNQHFRAIYLGQRSDGEAKIQFSGSREIRYVRPSKMKQLGTGK